MNLEYKLHTLKFKFEAGTSRGVYHEKDSWIIKIDHKGLEGYGECGPLKGLSPEFDDDIPSVLEEIRIKLANSELPKNQKEAYRLSFETTGHKYPSIRFALETALLDLIQGGKRTIFKNSFSSGLTIIPINGLIWMGGKKFMSEQVEEKKHRYGCLKMKIGALNIEDELALIKYIRSQGEDLVIRLDANGAFSKNEALDILNAVKALNIHSIEQPIKAGQWKEMSELVEASPVPVALDEELIGINELEEKIELLKVIKPTYIILKPTLHGGLSSCEEWIQVANRFNIGWWITSALESNIGLNAVSQFAAEVGATSYQGLGTGQLYMNNFESPLTIVEGNLVYDVNKSWNINLF